MLRAMSGLRLRHLGIATCALALAGGVACKKKQVEEVKKDLQEKKDLIAEVPLPEDALGELVIRDPEVFAKKIGDGTGFGAMIGPSPFDKLVEATTDENAKKALKALDPHGTLAAIVVSKIGPGAKPHGVAAARLRDPEIASAALAAAAKSGGSMKTWSSKTLETTVYELSGDAHVAVWGDVVIVSDDAGAIEHGAKYVAWRSAKSKVDHEFVVKIPMQKIGPTLKKLGSEEWAKVKPGDVPPKVKAELDPLVDPVLTGLADMGEIAIDLDVDGAELKFSETLAAKGTLSTWFAKYPAGDARPLLSMPKAESVSFVRFPDGLGPLLYSLADLGIDATSELSAAEKADASTQLRALGKALGNELAYATSKGKAAATGVAPGAPSLDTEIFLRLELSDPAAAKGAVETLRKLIQKVAGKSAKPTVAAYKKFGAEGETITTGAVLPSMAGLPGLGGAATPSKDNWVWAIKDGRLYLDACLGCAPALVDATLDPASKATLEHDPAAKTTIATFPDKGVTGASYSTSLGLPGTFGGLGAFMGLPSTPKSATGVVWSWSTISADGAIVKGTLPLSLLGDVVRGYLSIAGMGGAPPPY